MGTAEETTREVGEGGRRYIMSDLSIMATSVYDLIVFFRVLPLFIQSSVVADIFLIASGEEHRYSSLGPEFRWEAPGPDID